MTAHGSSTPEVQALLRVLAAGLRAAEIGTAFGEGAAAIAETAASLVTVEIDPGRAVAAHERLAGLAHVEVLTGDWVDHLPLRGTFELVFLDGGAWKRDPATRAAPVIDLLAPGGLLVADDFTPGRPVEADPAREFLFHHPRLVATEVLVSATMAVAIAARV